MSENLTDVLKQLSATIKKTIDTGISNGTLKSQEELYFHWKVDKYSYTDKGVTEYSAHGEYYTKQSWFKGIIYLEESVKKLSEYSYALEHLAKVFGKSDQLSQSLEYFIGKIIHQYLYNSKLEEIDINSIIMTFLKDLREEPLEYGAEVELEGIALQDKLIEPDFGTTLRQTQIEDLEREVPAYRFTTPLRSAKPSAILKIEFMGRRANEIQRRVELAISLLRLFKTGSIRYLSYRMHSESITDIMAGGIISSGRTGAALETCLITLEDVPKLRTFWQTMSNSIPDSFFDVSMTKSDYLTISYKRYCDALLENGLLERRIANAVMGLEALFLKPGEIQELPYRLGLRISKLFSLLENDPHEIKKIIDDAYKVRNLFAHGGQLGYDRKKKLESKYKDVKNLLLLTLNYLRISIIVMILSRKEKNEFIDLIDDSLIDRKKEEQLNQIITYSKDLLR